MTKIDLFFLGVYGAIVGFVVSYVLQGPIFGLFEYAVSLLIAVGSWYAGTSLVAQYSGTEVSMETAFRNKMWRWVFWSAMLLLAVCIVYALTVTRTRTSYPLPWLLLHFLVIYFAGTLVRVMTFSANRAVKSRKLAVERSQKAQQTKRENSGKGSDQPEA